MDGETGLHSSSLAYTSPPLQTKKWIGGCLFDSAEAASEWARAVAGPSAYIATVNVPQSEKPDAPHSP